MRHLRREETGTTLAASPWPYAFVRCGYCHHSSVVEAAKFPPDMILYCAPLACGKCEAAHSKHDRAIFIYCPEADGDRETFLAGAGPTPASHHRPALGR